MSRIVIDGATLVSGGSVKPRQTVAISGGRILTVGDNVMQESGDRLIRADGGYLLPGFIDVHVHGGGGSDFMDGTPAAFEEASMAHLRHGTTTLLPTAMASSDAVLERFFEAYRAVRGKERLPRMPGVHLEGPYLSPDMAGAMQVRHLRIPDPEHLERILRMARHSILRWTIAPELPGACEMGRLLTRRGILPSAGHSNGYYEDLVRACDNGFASVTHLYSSMSTIRRENGIRRAGMVEAALLLDTIYAEVIADGVHLPPELLRLVYKTKGAGRILAVTDSMRAACTDLKESVLGSMADGLRVVIADGVAKLPDFSSLAGSIATADRLLRVLHFKAGIPLQDAAQMLTSNPARLLRMENDIGLIAPGCRADLVMLDQDLLVQWVMKGGRMVRSPRGGSML